MPSQCLLQLILVFVELDYQGLGVNPVEQFYLFLDFHFCLLCCLPCGAGSLSTPFTAYGLSPDSPHRAVLANAILMLKDFYRL